MKDFKKIERQRLSHRVASEVEEAIISGEFEFGSRLPSEHVLADQFDVSRNVIREALKILQERQLIDTQNGNGTFIRSPNPDATRDALSRYLRLIGTDSSIKALYETRRILEGANARLAAQRADDEDLERLAACLTRMRESTNSIEDWSEADLDFHRAIARATHNPFLTVLLEPLVGQLGSVIAEGYLAPGAVRTGLDAHARIYECIKNGYEDGAYRATMNHLRDSEQRVETIERKHRTV